MKKIVLATGILAAFGIAQAADYAIDPHHANVRFAIDHFGTSTNSGGFYGLTGEVAFDADAGTGSVDVTIPLSALNSGNKDFDAHLQSADLFDAEKFPDIRFVSDKWEVAEGKVSRVEGKLTLLGKTHPVTLTATKFNCYDSPMLKTQVCGGDFETTIDRSQWGLDYLLDMGMSKEVKITIQIEAAKRQ